MSRAAEPPAMSDDLDTAPVERLCDDLAGLVSAVAVAVVQRQPWDEDIGPALSVTRRCLDHLAEVYNEFERSVEQRYAGEIAASEEP